MYEEWKPASVFPLLRQAITYDCAQTYEVQIFITWACFCLVAIVDYRWHETLWKDIFDKYGLVYVYDQIIKDMTICALEKTSWLICAAMKKREITW